jgi:superfamily II DNA or RNA helicase
VAGDYHERELADVMDRPELTADVVETWLKLGEARRTLCFAVNRAHARSLEQQFEKAGVSVAYVDAFTSREERNRIGEALAARRIQVVVNIATLTTGIDWPVECLILARPTKSEILFVQIVGRALRQAPGKIDALILDHSDTTLRLGFPDSIHHDVLDDGKPHATSARAAREKTPPLPKECPSCHYVKAAGVHKCPACGFEPMHREDIATRDGHLEQITGGKLEITREAKQRFWSGLRWYVVNKGKGEGWAAHRYRDKFGVWPRGLSDVARQPDVQVRNWVKAGAIAYAKAQEKRSNIAGGGDARSNAA